MKHQCVICEKGIGPQERCFLTKELKSICESCGNKEIDVWHVSMPDEPKNGYYDTDISHILDMLNECGIGEGYTVKKEKLKSVTYHNLPEFDGF